MNSLTANINGINYRVKVSDFSETCGPTSPGMVAQWTVYQNDADEIGCGVLIDLGKNFGYRLTIRNNRAIVTSQSFTRDQVIFTEQ